MPVILQRHAWAGLRRVIDGRAWILELTTCAARVHETTIGSWRPYYDCEVAEITKRQQFLAELAGEALAILFGLWMTFGLGWREFGPGLVLFGAVGFVVTCVRYRKSRTSAAAADGSLR
jgi:fatty acid desaturase